MGTPLYTIRAVKNLYSLCSSRKPPTADSEQSEIILTGNTKIGRIFVYLENKP
jgi:hypothetical protein